LRSGALQSRGRTKLGVRDDPGSAKQRFAKSYALHRARETIALIFILRAYQKLATE
jgi:hypothetical protein